MVITYLGGKTFSVKTKMTDITTGDEPRIGELTLSGPGEYEVGDVEVQGHKDASLFAAEGLNLLYINNPTGLSEEIVKAITEDIDIVLLTLDRDAAHVEAAAKTMKDLEAKVTIPAIDTSDHPFCKEVGGCPEAIPELKLSAKDLVGEERKIVVLHARSRARR